MSLINLTDWKYWQLTLSTSRAGQALQRFQNWEIIIVVDYLITRITLSCQLSDDHCNVFCGVEDDVSWGWCSPQLHCTVQHRTVLQYSDVRCPLSSTITTRPYIITSSNHHYWLLTLVTKLQIYLDYLHSPDGFSWLTSVDRFQWCPALLMVQLTSTWYSVQYTTLYQPRLCQNIVSCSNNHRLTSFNLTCQESHSSTWLGSDWFNISRINIFISPLQSPSLPSHKSITNNNVITTTQQYSS